MRIGIKAALLFLATAAVLTPKLAAASSHQTRAEMEAKQRIVRSKTQAQAEAVAPFLSQLEVQKKQIIGIELISANPGQTLESRFGHLLLRLVTSSPTGQSDLVVSFAALVTDAQLDPWKAVDGSYPLALQIERVRGMQMRYALSRQSLRRLIVPTSVTQRLGLVEKILNYGKDPYRYRFFSSNCATELMRLLEANQILISGAPVRDQLNDFVHTTLNLANATVGRIIPNKVLDRVLLSGQTPYPVIPLNSGLVKVFAWLHLHDALNGSFEKINWPQGSIEELSKLSDPEKFQLYLAMPNLPNGFRSELDRVVLKYSAYPPVKRAAIATGMRPIPPILYESCNRADCTAQILAVYPKIWREPKRFFSVLRKSHQNSVSSQRDQTLNSYSGFSTTANILSRLDYKPWYAFN